MALRSDDPYDPPKLDIGYLTDSEGADLATLRCGFRAGTETACLQSGIPHSAGYTFLCWSRDSACPDCAYHNVVFLDWNRLSLGQRVPTSIKPSLWADGPVSSSSSRHPCVQKASNGSLGW